MFATRLPYPGERILELHAKCDAMIASGEHLPYTYPLGATGGHLILLYLLVNHRGSPLLKSLRWPIWFLNLGFALFSLRYFRAHDAPIAYGCGFGAMWTVVWSAAFLLFYDAQKDFCRMERTEGAFSNPGLGHARAHANGTANGSVVRGGNSIPLERDVDETSLKQPLDKGARVWQSYPVHSLIERVDWVFDLFTEFRGVTWNWRSPIYPNPPKPIMDDVGYSGNIGHSELNPFRKTHAETFAHPERTELLRDAAKRLVYGYLTLDILKTIMIHDPYWSGYVTEPAPAWMGTMIVRSPILTRCIRLILGMVAIKTILATVFALGPISFVGILGKDLIGVRGEAWAYPLEWGSYRFVLDKGLEGWWGIWWHQSFRFAFEAPGRKLAQYLRLNPKSTKAKAVQLVVAFMVSGTLHGCASHTTLGPTHPITGPFLFFFLQPFGIGINMVLNTGMKKVSLPKQLRQLVNFVWVHFWFYHVASLLVEDFCVGGTFLVEPIPISPLRALGFGVPGSPWFAWAGRWAYWHNDKAYWWRSGWAF